MVLLRQAGGIIVRLLPRVVQHQRVRLVSDGDSAGPLRPGLPVHLHRHLGALQDQLVPNTTQSQQFKGALTSPFTTAIVHICSLAREKLTGTHRPQQQTSVYYDIINFY